MTRGDEPDIAKLAALVAEPARARMLEALMSGQALTATELAIEASIAPSTASGHLARLERGSVIAMLRQGRHRYYRLADRELAGAIEGLMALARRRTAVRHGPADPALRHARVCYDHLAGEVAVELADGLLRRGLLAATGGWTVTAAGERFFAVLGIHLDALRLARRPLVRECLDWSERRSHLAGALGAALLERVFARGWAVRERGSRIVTFTAAGERWLAEQSGRRRAS